ncbi:MAG TPA: hypothetical protein PKW36_06760 [bacterium]|nr:hypothetical protein [bacterium]
MNADFIRQRIQALTIALEYDSENQNIKQRIQALQIALEYDT